MENRKLIIKPTLFIRIDEDLKAKFKSKCALNKETISSVLIEFIQKYIE